jgi:hypothetical protein
MKITAIKTEQGLEKDKDYDLCEMSAKNLICAGIAIEKQDKKDDNNTKHTTSSATVKPKRSKTASKSR